MHIFATPTSQQLELRIQLNVYSLNFGKKNQWLVG